MTALDGTAWRVTVVAGTPTGDDVVTTIRFDDGRAAGRGGVNRFSGPYRLWAAEGITTIVFGAVMSTRMAGPPAAMAQESRWFAALGGPSLVETDGDAIELVHADGTRSRLEPEDQPPGGASPA